MTELPNGVNWLYTEAERRNSILADTRGMISIDTHAVLPGDEPNPHPFYANTAYGASIVRAYKEEIYSAAMANSVNPDLLAAVIYLENAHGVMKDFLAAPLGLNSSLLPANVEISHNPSTNWSYLIGKTPEEVWRDPAATIEIAAVLLSRIADRLPNPTPSVVATLYNALSADERRTYGMTVEIYMETQPWRLEDPREIIFDTSYLEETDNRIGFQEGGSNNWRLGKDDWRSHSTLAGFGWRDTYIGQGVAMGSGYERSIPNNSLKSELTGYSAPGMYDLEGPELAQQAAREREAAELTAQLEAEMTEAAGEHEAPEYDSDKPGPQPILLDLDNNGLSITELAQSSHFVDGGDGLMHRTAWAAAGDGVLFYDVSGDGQISERREYVFTDWAPGATRDLEALRAVFETNSEGKLTSADGTFASFKVMATRADGNAEAKTLAQLGITGIDLRDDATQIELPDGSVITGKTTFNRTNGTTGAVGDMVLMAEGEAYRKRGAIRAARCKVIELTPTRFLSINNTRPTQVHNAIGGC